MRLLRVNSIFALALVALLSHTSDARAETILQNDSVAEDLNGSVASAELIEGEMYEAVFDIPQDWLPLEMLGVRTLMFENPNKNGLACGRFTVEVWDEGNNMAQSANCVIGNVRYKDPGALIFSGSAVMNAQGVVGFEIKGDESRGSATFKDIRFSEYSSVHGLTVNPVILNTTRVRVAVKALDRQCLASGGGQSEGDYFPVMASDQDMVSASLQNFVYGEPCVDLGSGCDPICTPAGAQHYAWEDFATAFTSSTPGDFVLRLIVDYTPPADPDAGMGGGDVGMSNLDAGFSDAGSDMGTMAPDAGYSSDLGTGSDDMGSGGDDNGENGEGGNGVLSIESISPNEGTSDQSVDVVILGKGFEPGVEVLVGSDNIGVTETRSERIRATIPEGYGPGTYDVIVTNPSGASARLENGYTVFGSTPVDSEDPDGKRAATGDGCGCDTTRDRTIGFGALIFAFFALLLTVRRRGLMIAGTVRRTRED